MYTVDGVLIDIGVTSSSAVEGLERLERTLRRIRNLAGGGLGLGNIQSQLNGLNNSAKSVSLFAKSLVSLMAVQKILTTSITKSNEYVENLNLFNVALGKYADEAKRYAEVVERVMGIDSSEWMRNQGTFMQIASGFGMAEESAYSLSKALTQVSYDIASFYNISTEEAMLKVRSGIAGELEPLRNLGYALDTATLQQIAYANGIDMKVNAMTQAQKAELRYVAIMSQSKNAINDMSRTYYTSANQIRLLSSQINILARALGNVLIPAINAVLPVAITFVNTITSVINAIAGLFGFTLPSIDWSGGLSDASNAAGDLGSNLGSAGGSAKKLKNVLMGFDELNVMPDAASGGGGGGAGGGGALGGSLGIKIDDYMYDFLDGMYEKAKDVNWAVAGIAAAIAGLAIPASTLLGWKNLSNIIGGVITLGAMLRINFELAAAYLREGNVSYVIGQTGIAMLAGGIFTTILQNSGFVGKGKSWRYGFGSALAIDAGITLAAIYEGVEEGEVDPFDEKTIISGVKGIIEAALGGALIAGKTGAAIGLIITTGVTLATMYEGIENGSIDTNSAEIIKAGAANVLQAATAGLLIAGPVGGIVGLTLGAAVTLAVTKIAVDNQDDVLLYGDVTLAADEIRGYAEMLLGQPVEANLKLINNNIEGLDMAKENLDAAVDVLSVSTRLIQLGIDTSSEAATRVGEEAKTVIAEAQKMLDQQKTSISTLVSIVMPTDKDGNDIGTQYMEAFSSSVSALQSGYEWLGNRMTEWVTAGAEDGIDEYERQMITAYSQAIQNVSNAISKGQMQGGMLAQLDFALSDLDKKSMEAVFAEIADIKTQAEETGRKAAEEQMGALTSNLYALKALQEAMLIEGQTDSDAYRQLEEEIRTAQAALDSFDVTETADAYVREFVTQAKPKILEAVLGWLDIGDNVSVIGGEVGEKLARVVEGAAQTGNYNYAAALVVDAIEAELEKAGIDLSSVGLTGVDVLTSDMKETLDEVFAEYGIPYEVIQNLWKSFDPVTGKIIQTIRNSQTGAVSAMSDVISAIKHEANKSAIKIKVGLKSDGSALKVTGAGGTGLDVKTIQLRASGGIPDQGTMFIAGEAGPELVGKIGNKTGVVNAGQISEIISAEMARNGGSGGNNEEAVARAVAAALNNMELKVDGDSFGRIAVKTINKRRQISGKVELIL